VDGTAVIGRWSGLQEEIQSARKPQAGWHCCWEHQEAGLEVLPAEVGALPDRTVPALDKGPPTAGGQCPTQARDHLFKVCPEWKAQQKILWAEVREETGRWTSRWKVWDHLLANGGRCGQAVLDFLSSTGVGRLAPPGEDEGSEVSEGERMERIEREDKRRAEAEALGDGGAAARLTPAFMASADKK